MLSKNFTNIISKQIKVWYFAIYKAVLYWPDYDYFIIMDQNNIILMREISLVKMIMVF